MTKGDRFFILLLALLAIAAFVFTTGGLYEISLVKHSKTTQGYKLNRWTGTATLLQGNQEFALHAGEDYRRPTAPPPPQETIERGANQLFDQFFKGLATELQKLQGAGSKKESSP